MERSHDKVWRVGFAVVLIAAAVLLCYGIDRPFVGQHESAAACVANYARNMVRYGYWGTKMGLILDSGPLPEAGERHYYLHCTPLLSFLVSISFRLFGVHEWSARLVPIVQALACVALLMLIAQRLAGPGTAVAAGAILALSPVFAYYGRVAEFVTFGTGFILLALYGYVRWRQMGSRRWLAVTLAGALLGVLCSFEGWPFPLVLAGHYWLTTKRRSLAVWLLPLTVVLGMGLHAAHVAWLIGWGAMASDSLSVLGRRSAFGGGAAGPMAAAGQLARWSWHYVTAVPLVLAGLWAVAEAVRRRRSVAAGMVAVLLTNRAVVSLVFAGHAASHEFSLYGFMPGLALAGALGLEAAVSACRSRGGRVGVRCAWVLVCALAAAYALQAARQWHGIHARRFYGPWYELALRLNRVTGPEDGLTMNLSGPYRYPGYYLPFYLDRRVKWGVGCVAQAKEALLDGTGRYTLAVLFSRDPDSGQIGMRMFGADEIRATPEG